MSATATIDLADPVYGEGLARALDESSLLSSACLGNLASCELLSFVPGEAGIRSNDSPRLRFARRLFGLEGESGWEPGLVPDRVDAITLSRQTILFREAENLLLRRCQDDADLALLISVSNTLEPSSAQALSRRLSSAGAATPLPTLLGSAPDVLAGATISLQDGTITATHARPDGASRVRLQDAFAAVLADAMNGTLHAGARSLVQAAEQAMERVTCLEFEADGQLYSFSQVPMVPGAVLDLQGSLAIDMGVLRRIQREALNDALRRAIGTLLEGDLPTQITPFPETEVEFQAIVRDLRRLDDDDLIARLDIGGFAPHGFGEGEDLQQCRECIYYLPHRKWCDIPELPLPVEPHWWCRLWKL